MTKPKFETPNGTTTNINALSTLFPGVVTEGKVNFDLLRTLLGDDVFTDEAYEFTWVGKRDAIAEAGRPIRKTLRPVRDDETTPTGADTNDNPYCSTGSVNWDTTENLYIEGDNLDVLKLLQESYLGKVKMIYIDPPYNTGKDSFVYPDNFTMSEEEYEEATEMYDEDGQKLFKDNSVNNPRFHSDWCSMMYSRLALARNILSADGVICVSIDDHEAHNTRKLCDEVFGVENFVTQFIVIRSEGGGLAKQAVIGHDYLLVYSKNIESFPPLGKPKDIRGKIEVIDGEEYWIETDWLRKEFGKYGTLMYEDIVSVKGQEKKDEIDAGLDNKDYVLIPKNEGHIVGRYRKVADDTSKFYTILKHLNKLGVQDLDELKMKELFSFPKSISLLKEVILGATIKKRDAIVLDFFSGSATTAHAVMQLNAEDSGNRKFIMVQLPEVTDPKSEAHKADYHHIHEIGKERIRRAGKKVLADWQAKQTQLSLDEQSTTPPDIGFRVLKLDDTNMNDVYYTPGELTMDMLASAVSNIKPDRTDMDLLYGCLLDWGLPLSMPHTTQVIDNHTIHTYNDGDLIACFDPHITQDTMITIAKRKPLRAVFIDAGFTDSASKINVFELFKLHAPNTSVKVI